MRGVLNEQIEYRYLENILNPTYLRALRVDNTKEVVSLVGYEGACFPGSNMREVCPS